jgi:hypothetical protein
LQLQPAHQLFHSEPLHAMAKNAPLREPTA